MLSAIIRRKNLYIGVVIILFIALYIFCFILPKSQEPSSTKSSTNSDNSVDKRVFIKDFQTYDTYFNAEKQRAIENVLYTYASHYNTVPDLYTGVIRAGSLSQTKNIDGYVYTSIIIDINPTNTAYVLSVKGTSKDSGIRPVSIKCVPKEQQKDPTASCVAGEDE